MVTIKLAAGHIGWSAAWAAQRYRWVAVFAVACLLAGLGGSAGWAAVFAVLALAPAVVAGIWHGLAPVGYERWAAGPSRRAGWWWMIRTGWHQACRDCRLAERQTVTKKSRDGNATQADEWSFPRLRRVRVRGNAVQLRVRARRGQTLTELESGAERLAALWDAHAFRHWPDPKAPASTLMTEFVMRDVLTDPTRAVAPDVPRAVFDRVRLGRTQAGTDWMLPIRGRHTLCVGASGSGKGSVLWGICGGLAPAVHADMVRLWGIDLKRGVELAIGEPLFTARAYNPTDAVKVLTELMAVIDRRGAVMAGNTRLHEPSVGDPLHVLVIDELAALTAYAPVEIRRDAERLLAEILTQGRALGVVVVAFVQDPRKEVVNMRGLFTQTIALRLRSGDETAMVLGDGMHRLAPAHRIDPTQPGTGWIVEDTGAVDRTRADYWDDDLIRLMAGRYATEAPRVDLDAISLEKTPGPLVRLDPVKDDRTGDDLEAPRKRSPRKPRQPRSEQPDGLAS